MSVDSSETDVAPASHDEPLPTMEVEAGANLIKQCLDLWVEPEIRRRQERGLLPQPAKLRAFQVVMNVDSPLQVRLNEELISMIAVGPAEKFKGRTIGSPIYWDEIEELYSVTLTDADPVRVNGVVCPNHDETVFAMGAI